MAFELKAHEILALPPKSRMHLATFLFPLTDRVGYVAGLCAIKTKTDAGQLVNELFREHLNRLAESIKKGSNAEHRFEQFLSGLNHHLAHEVRTGALSIPIQEFHAVACVVCEQDMFLSGAGDLCVLFLHRTEDGRYQVFNLARSIQTEQVLPSWEKPFAVLLDGRLNAGDVWCAASRDLPRDIPAQELHALLATLPPKGAAERIRQYLPAAAELAAVLIQASEIREPRVRLDTTKDRSAQELLLLSETTEDMIGDHAPSPLKGLLSRLKRRSSPARTLQEGHGVFAVIRRTIVRIPATVSSFVAQRKKEKQTHPASNSPRTLLRDKILPWRRRYRGVPVRGRILILCGILCLLLFGGGIVLVRNRHQEKTAVEAQAAKGREIKGLLDEAQAALIYKNESRTRELLTEAKIRLSAWQGQTGADTDTVAGFQETMTALEQGLRRETVISHPSILTPTGSGQAVAFFPIESDLILIGKNGSGYRYNIPANTLTPLTLTGTLGAPSLAGAQATGSYILDETSRTLNRLDTKTWTVSSANVSQPEQTKWVDLDLYNGKLYALQTGETDADTSLERFAAAGNGFGTSSRWIKSRTTPLADAVSFAIDGAIYILKKDGQVVRFQNGAEETYRLGSVSPPLRAASRLFTSIDTLRLYILEPESGRLAVFDKQTGAFIRQYRSDAFKTASDFLVDETKKAAYLLTPEQVYRLPFE
ncbi:hypothetical protein HYV73_04230 [Candidatus Uhrbacteria bacterium]|nr:hypothetical protein [Candidatus Uhrbacteria bacterium]